MKLFALLVLTAAGCATTLPPQACPDPYTDVSLTADGLAQPGVGGSATVRVTLHNPHPRMVEVELGCGREGGRMERTFVRLSGKMHQVLLFNANPQTRGAFLCQVVNAEPFEGE